MYICVCRGCDVFMGHIIRSTCRMKNAYKPREHDTVSALSTNERYMACDTWLDQLLIMINIIANAYTKATESNCLRNRLVITIEKVAIFNGDDTWTRHVRGEGVFCWANIFQNLCQINTEKCYTKKLTLFLCSFLKKGI